MKLTEDPEKQTLPGSKTAFRLLGSDGEALQSPQFSSEPQAPSYVILGAPSRAHTHTGSLLLDVLQLAEEPPPQAGRS